MVRQEKQRSNTQRSAIGQPGDSTTDKMAAEGEIAAENLGNATINNKYNSSTSKESNQ